MNPSSQSTSRRNFVKTVTLVTAWSSLPGKAWTDVFAADVAPLSTSTVGTLKLKLSDFPALLNESGSVRLGFSPLVGGPPSGPMPTNTQFYPVIINRGPNNTFFALNSRCTHMNCTVDPLDPFSGQITCPCHGSIFDIDGRRLGGMALTSLQRYTVRFAEPDTLEVLIPGLGYAVTAAGVQGGGDPAARLRLDFRAQRILEYEVRRRDAVDKESTPVLFSTTPDGPLDQLVYSRTATANVSLYVARDSAVGFYTVGVLFTEM